MNQINQVARLQRLQNQQREKELKTTPSRVQPSIVHGKIVANRYSSMNSCTITDTLNGYNGNNRIAAREVDILNNELKRKTLVF